MLQAPRTLGRRISALGATLVALHAQLVLALPGNREGREFVLDWFSHVPYRQI